MTKSPTPKRPRGRPVTGRPPKRNVTMRLAADVADYLEAIKASGGSKATVVETAVRSTDSFKSHKAKNDSV